MQSDGGVVVVIGVFVFLAFLAIVIVLAVRANEKRLEQLEALVRQYEWQLVAEPDRNIQDRYSGRPFRSPGRGRVRDLVTGRHRGQDFLAFQFSYSTGNGESSTTHHFVHAAVRLPGAAPRVEIKDRGVGSKIAEAFGAQPFRLDDPAFDEQFTVRTDSDAFARALLQDGLAAWLTGMPFPNPLVVDGAELRTWTSGALRAETLPPLLNYLCDAMERVPAQAWPAPRG